MSKAVLQVVYSEMLVASAKFKSQAPIFRQITENGIMAFQGACYDNLYLAQQAFFDMLDAGQQSIAESIEGHGMKLKLAHDNYDQGETATTMSAQALFQALKDPGIIK